MLYDDRRGAGEPLNETGQYGDGLIIRGKQYVMLDNITFSTYFHRMFGEVLMLEPELLFAESAQSFNETLNDYVLRVSHGNIIIEEILCCLFIFVGFCNQE